MRIPSRLRLHHPFLTRITRKPSITTTATMSTTAGATASPAQLPPLPEVDQLAPGCIRILAGNPGKFTLQGTNTYLVGTGAARLLIDTGEGRPAWAAAVRRVLEGEGAVLAAVLLTHWHRDHTGGVADVLRAWPGTPVYKRRRGEEQQQQQHELQDLLDIADGQRFAVPGASLTAVHTPGHTADHMVFVWEEAGAVFTGDNVLGHGTSVFEDLGAYVASLERMQGLFGGTSQGEAGRVGGGGRAYPGHGAVVEDGPAKIAEYIRHRGQREEQVVQTLRADNAEAAAAAAAGDGHGGAWTLMELVRSIYRDVPETLHPAAAGGVIQILQKLQREGKVVAVEGDEQRWRLTSAAGSGRSAL